jgi:transglutaminase-like putative cysteine protease
MQKMKNLISISLLLLSCSCFAADIKYPVSEIPEELKKGMYAVVREKEFIFEINSVSSSKYRYRMAITLLNSNAKSYADLVVGYDKLQAVKLFKCTSYDAMGNVIKKLKQSEIRDVSAYDEYSLFSDNRLKIADLSQATYPYTVEFEYEVEMKLLFSIPDFYLYTDDEVSIQKSIYQIAYPVGLKPRYKLFKIQEPAILTLEKKEALVWSFENIKPEKFEKLGPDFPKVTPNIMVAPVDFEFGGYAGKMDTWENFGRWITKLNEGRDVLPEATKQLVRELTKDAKTPEEKARLLYKYLQDKTRYVSIQLGIGGFQPFEATVVDQTGYGDCKALSNYMVSLLREVGVKAYYTTIMAGDDAQEVDPSFPSQQANHVIVAVPNKKDTLWLECTNQTNPFGYLGSFTGDRFGLMITENGGKLVRTISYAAEDNLQIRSANVVVAATGDARANITTSYSGLQYENHGLSFALNRSYDDQKKWVQENTEISSFDVNSFSMKNRKDKIPSAIVDLDLNLKRLASVSGKRIFLTPNLMNRSTYIPEKLGTRKTNIVLRTAGIDIDSIHFILPEGMYPELLPEPVTIKSRFGEYKSTYKIDDQGLWYVRRMKMVKGEFPPDSYQELVDFFKGISKADNTKLVLLNKT